MTNNLYKTIFIHFSKTGGSSIENYFGSGDGVITTEVTLTDGSRKTMELTFGKTFLSFHLLEIHGTGLYLISIGT